MVRHMQGRWGWTSFCWWVVWLAYCRGMFCQDLDQFVYMIFFLSSIHRALVASWSTRARLPFLKYQVFPFWHSWLEYFHCFTEVTWFGVWWVASIFELERWFFRDQWSIRAYDGRTRQFWSRFGRRWIMFFFWEITWEEIFRNLVY